MAVSRRAVTLFCATSLVAVACADSALMYAPLEIPNNPSPCAALDTREVPMDRPPAPRPWDTSDVELSAAVAAAAGHATVAFKEAASAHVMQTGFRAAVTAKTVCAGLDMLRANGVEIVDLYDVMGAAHVRMDANLAPRVRVTAIVDFVEPVQEGGHTLRVVNGRSTE